MSKQDLYQIQNLRAFEVKYLCPTNSKGARVKIKDLRNGTTKIVSWDYDYNNISEIALEYLNAQGFEIVKKVCLDDSDLLLVENFEETFK